MPGQKPQNWTPYEENLPRAAYECLKSDKASRMMTDEEAKSLLHSKLGLDPSRVSVIREVDELETDTCGRLRRTGRKLDRTPYYNTDDWFFIRFGVGEFQCEMYGSGVVAPCTY